MGVQLLQDPALWGRPVGGRALALIGNVSAQAGQPVRDLQVSAAALEDAFLQLTGSKVH